MSRDHLSHRNTRKTRKSAPSLPHPLTAFLADADQADSRLWRIARQKSTEPFDLERFRAELLDKLRRVHYSQPRDPERRKYTFHDRMERAGLMRVFLRTSILRGISQWLLLKDIVRADLDAEQNRLSVERLPLRFHASLISRLSRHGRAVAALMGSYNAEKPCLGEYQSAIGREEMRQLRIMCLSRWPGSRESLLGKHRNEDVVATIGIFDQLKVYFGNAFPDRFLRRLSQLVCAPVHINSISDDADEALRIALSRQK